MKKNRLFYSILSIIMILMYALIGILGIPEAGNNTDFEQIKAGYYIIGILFIVIITLFNFDIFKHDLKDYFKHFPKNIWHTIKFLLIGLVVFSISRFLTYLIINVTPTGDSLIKSAFQDFPVYIIFVTVIYTPYVEEMIFRKLLSDIIPNKYLFIITSASIFAYFHAIGDFSNVTQFISLFVPVACFGAVIAYSYRKTNNIFVPILIHLLYNSFVFLTFNI